jgi:CHAT domain-containing protein
MGVDMVLVSPDGAFARFPPAALPGKRPGTYLNDEAAVVVVPVPQLLGELRAGAQSRPSGEDKMLVVGNVDYGEPAVKAQGAEWPALPATITETRDVSDIFRRYHPNGTINMLTGSNATAAEVRALLGGNRFVHLATHAYVERGRSRRAANTRAGCNADPVSDWQLSRVGPHPGLLVGLAFAGANRERLPERPESFLTALELAELDLAGTDLVVLSACESGTGPDIGEGELGLQRAFQVASASTVVASLWRVDDESTERLMTDFYRELWGNGVSAEEALRRAQKSLRNSPGGADPVVWAAWVASGEPSIGRGPGSRLARVQPVVLWLGPILIGIAAALGIFAWRVALARRRRLANPTWRVRVR